MTAAVDSGSGLVDPAALPASAKQRNDPLSRLPRS